VAPQIVNCPASWPTGTTKGAQFALYSKTGQFVIRECGPRLSPRFEQRAQALLSATSFSRRD
jgi:hypothetical protein